MSNRLTRQVLGHDVLRGILSQKEWVLDFCADTAGASGVPHEQGATSVNARLFGSRCLAEAELFLRLDDADNRQ